MTARVLLTLLIACGGSKPQPAPGPTVVAPVPEPAPASAPAVDLVGQGKELMNKLGCIACHSIDGTSKVGPTLKGYFGAKLTTEDGTPVVGDEARFRASFDKPQPLKGYPPSMPAYADNATEAQRAALVAYVKTL